MKAQSTNLFLTMVYLLLTGCASTSTDPAAIAAIETHEVRYVVDEQPLQGYLALPGGSSEPRAAVLVVHEWWGHNDYVRARADQLAKLGYVAFALDMYGAGKQATHPSDAQAFMGEVMGNRETMQARFKAALGMLKAHEAVDPERIAAIGYCMGGAIVLDMARAGTDLAATVSFHGSLSTGFVGETGAIQGPILVCTGGDDPFVSAEQVDAFRQEMQTNGANFEIVSYPGVVHAFTNPAATAKGLEFGLPLRHDPLADSNSWSRMLQLFQETLK